MGQRELMDSGIESFAPQQGAGASLVQDAYERGDWSVLKVQNKQDGTGHESGQDSLPKLGEPKAAEPQPTDRGAAVPNTDAPVPNTDGQPDGTKTDRTADALKAMDKQSPAVKSFVEVLDKFDKAPDKAKAMEELGPQFEASIKTADNAFGAAMKDVMDNGPALKEKMAEAGEELQAHLENVGAEMDKLPEADQAKVKDVMVALLKEQDPAKEQELLKQLEPFDRVHAAVGAFNEALNKHEPTMKRLDEMSKNMEQTLSETAALRLGYSGLLKESGDNEKADQVEGEAEAILKMMLGGFGQEQQQQDPDNDGVPRFRTLPWIIPQQDREIEMRQA
jgi:hypothetical protein